MPLNPGGWLNKVSIKFDHDAVQLVVSFLHEDITIGSRVQELSKKERIVGEFAFVPTSVLESVALWPNRASSKLAEDSAVLYT